MLQDPNSADLSAIYQDIKERVEKRYQWRTQLAGHVVGYVVFLIAGSFIVSEESIFNGSTYGLIAAVWFGGLMIHVMNVLFSELRERAMQRELERAGIFPGMIAREKAKHDSQSAGNERLVRLTEDGELVDVNHYEDGEYGQQAQQPR